ncbi:MAG: nucleotidyl transferase AbiEii/AbiGii toxin family protein [Ruminococcus sp.]|nr:nucleotidyl transferase AbiEii/AbiGii toxin family protein [Ruminococcus sp.]
MSETELPLIFKGALVTKAILENNSYSETERLTKDIDVNWVGDPPSMEILTCAIDECVTKVNPAFKAVAFRDYGANRAAGFKIIDRNTNEVSFKIDVDMRSVTGKKTYYFGDISFSGVLPSEIIADKIVVSSSPLIYKHRAKDMIDLYALTHCVDVSLIETLTICKQKGNSIQDFDGFRNHRAETEHAYDKLRGVEGKPDFQVVYGHLTNFLMPFMNDIDRSLVWSCGRGEWYDSTPKRQRSMRR